MLVIGNGESRTQINLDKIKDTKIGCNAILRDTQVNHLVCVDKPMLREAFNTSYHKHAKVWTRKDWFVQYRLEKNIRMLPDLPYAGSERWDEEWHWGAGPYAVLLGAQKSKSHTIKMIGFDLYGIHGKVNNVYKDTENYAVSDKKEVDPRYWIYQIGKVFECFPKIQFKIYQDNDWKMPNQWKKSNVCLDSISNIYYNT